MTTKIIHQLKLMRLTIRLFKLFQSKTKNYQVRSKSFNEFLINDNFKEDIVGFGNDFLSDFENLYFQGIFDWFY